MKNLGSNTMNKMEREIINTVLMSDKPLSPFEVEKLLPHRHITDIKATLFEYSYSKHPENNRLVRLETYKYWKK